MQRPRLHVCLVPTSMVLVVEKVQEGCMQEVQRNWVLDKKERTQNQGSLLSPLLATPLQLLGGKKSRGRPEEL